MANNIFEISENYLKIIAELEESQGELTPELEERLNITKDELEAKIRAYRSVIQQKEALVEIAKDEKNRLNDKQKSTKNLVDRLKKIISYAVDTFGEVPPKGKSKKLTFNTLSVFNKETKQLIINDVNKIPIKYLKRGIVVKEEDLDAIRGLLSDYEIVISEDKIVNNDSLKTALEQQEKDKKAEIPVDNPISNEAAYLQTNVTPVFN